MEGPTHAINAEAASASASQAASAQASQAATAHLQLQPRPHGHYGIGGVMKLVGEKTHLTPYHIKAAVWAPFLLAGGGLV